MKQGVRREPLSAGSERAMLALPSQHSTISAYGHEQRLLE
jgi:hypothetical protein